MTIGIAALYLLSVLAPGIFRRLGRKAYYLLALAPAALFAHFLTLLPRVQNGQAVVEWLGRSRLLGVRYELYIDGLSLVFCLLITLTGALIVAYAGDYLHGEALQGRFLSYLLAFMASMLGLVCSGDLLVLFFFWELTSITSFLLIGFHSEEEKARRSALQALLVTGAGGLALMAGIVLVGQVAGTYELRELFTKGALLRSHPYYPAILILVLGGAFTKSAQWPFYFWLPGAMVAPAPVSAYLHSATMVKAGVYLLARLSPVLGQTPAWELALTAVGAITMLLGSWLALVQSDLKRALAYSTVAVLGTLVMLLGLGAPGAEKAMIVYLAAHSLYKAALFLVVGTIDHETGQRDLHLLGGLGRAMPFTAAGALLAALSMGGVLPALGFIAKEYYKKAAMAHDSQLVLGLAVVSAVAMVTVALLAGWRPFWMGTLKPPAHMPHHIPLFAMWAAPLLLGTLGLLGGVFIAPVGKALFVPATVAILGRPFDYDFALWKGADTAFWISMGALVCGGILFAFWPRLQRLADPHRWLGNYGPTRLYERSYEGMLELARWHTRILQNGSLARYVAITLSVPLVLAGGTLLWRVPLGWPRLHGLDAHEITLALLISASAGYLLQARSMITAIVLLSIVGFGVTITFMNYGAPDLAITQLVIETLSVLLFLLVVYRLPRFVEEKSGVRKTSQAVLAVAVGALLALLLAQVMAGPPPEGRISGYFLENAYTLAHGTNVVNVILVDFRALDTLGEITVLAIGALGVYALLRLHKDGPEKPVPCIRQPGASQLPYSAIVSGASRLLLPLLLLFSLFLLLRGHYDPGGGFVGGLVAASAFILYALTYGTAAVRETLPIGPRRLVGVGLATALVSAMAGLFAGDPVLRGLWLSRPVPALGLLGTPLLFDVGVYLAVVGVVLTMILTLAEEE